MSKKKLMMILLPVLGIASFGLSFVVAGKLAPPPPKPVGADKAAAATAAQTAAMAVVLPEGERSKPKEQQLDQLIKDLQFKTSELTEREGKVQEREKRLQMAEQTLKLDAQELEKLRAELVVPLRQLKEQIAELQLTRVAIGRQERENLKKAAAMYAGMKDTAAAKILEGMNEDQAVKILYYVGQSDERMAGKILAKVDPKFAIKLTDMLKRIEEREK